MVEQRCVGLENVIAHNGILFCGSGWVGYILKPILFYLLIILFDGSGDINFSYCWVGLKRLK